MKACNNCQWVNKVGISYACSNGNVLRFFTTEGKVFVNPFYCCVNYVSKDGTSGTVIKQPEAYDPFNL